MLKISIEVYKSKYLANKITNLVYEIYQKQTLVK